MKQEESRLKLKAEVAKTSAKERALAAMTTPFLPQLQPVKLEPRLNDQDSAVPFRVSRTIRKKFHIQSEAILVILFYVTHIVYSPQPVKI